MYLLGNHLPQNEGNLVSDGDGELELFQPQGSVVLLVNRRDFIGGKVFFHLESLSMALEGH